jgi:hypothetical protein
MDIQNPKKPEIAPPPSFRTLFPAVLGLAALLLAALFAIPLLPMLPTRGLDASWAYALNVAVANHLVFGRDLIFTFGPLGSAYTWMYHPATDLIMVVSSTLLAVGLCSGFYILAFRRRPLLLLLVPALVAAAHSRDATFMAIPFLLLLSTVVVCYRVGTPNPTRSTGTANVVPLLLMACACGMLPLVKGSFGALTALLGLLTLVLLVRSRKAWLALALCVTAAFSMVASWILVGQPLSMLVHFFVAQTPIITGYAGAMSSHGSFAAVATWAAAATVCAGVFYWYVGRLLGLDGVIVSVGLVAFLFILFKAGFVRQDSGHIYTASAALLFVALSLATLIRPRVAIALGLLVWLAWGSIIGQSMVINPLSVARLTWDAVQRTSAGIRLRVFEPDRLPAMFASANAKIRSSIPVPAISGTVDVYPTELSIVFANGFRWAGRPILQSYSAYTPSLSEANARHLLGSDAPQSIFYSLTAIDQRLPVLEDSASLPVLLTQYKVVRKTPDFLQLGRDQTVRRPVIKPLSSIDAHLNAPIDVPDSSSPIVARIQMSTTPLGALASAAFKLPQVHIETTLANGTVVEHRFVPKMGEAGFIVSPYIGSLDDFLMLAGGVAGANRVTRIRITAPDIGLWHETIHVTFSSFNVAPQIDARDLVVVSPSNPKINIATQPGTAAAQCARDAVDGVPTAPHKANFVAYGGVVSLSGWAAPSAQKGIGPDQIWILLTAPDGTKRFYAAPTTSRLDVQQAFQQPRMSNVGFNLKLYAGAVKTQQELAIYTVHEGLVQDCGIRATLSFQ